MVHLNSGTILIADPFLKDPNFMRTAVFLCEHQPEGSMGFILNRKHNKVIEDLINGLKGCKFPVYYGGPLQTDTVSFLHQCPGIIAAGVEISDGIFWGGELEEASILIQNKKISQSQIRFYLGYSGWGENQLTEELSQRSWLTTYGNKQLVFHRQIEMIWPDAIRQIGGEYEQIINYPLDPQLN